MTAQTAPAMQVPAAGVPPIRVLYFHHGSVPGGAPVSLANLVAGLEGEGGVEARIACINEAMATWFAGRTGAATTVVPDPGVGLGKVMIGWAPLWMSGTLLRLPGALAALPGRVRRCRQWLESERPDIVHLNSATLLTVALAARRARIPCVWHVREVNLGARWNPRRWLAGYLLRRLATAVVAISPAEAASLGPDRRGNVHVVYNFVDERSFHDGVVSRAQSRRDLGLPPEAPVVASLGGVSFRKGTWQLIESLQRLPRDAHLVIAGPPPASLPPGRRVRWLAPALLRLEDLLVASGIRAYHLWHYGERVRRACLRAPRERLHFTGIVDDVRPVLAACDVLVFAGTTPHFPRPVYEAWMMRRPVAVFDVAGVRDNVEHGVDGVVVSLPTGDALAGAVAELLGHPQRAAAMASAGRARALERFSRGPALERVSRIYASVRRQARKAGGNGAAPDRAGAG